MKENFQKRIEHSLRFQTAFFQGKDHILLTSRFKDKTWTNIKQSIKM